MDSRWIRGEGDCTKKQYNMDKEYTNEFRFEKFFNEVKMMVQN